MKKTNGMPEWFNLENYRETELLTPAEWLENLYKRSKFFEYHEIAESPELFWIGSKEEYTKKASDIVDFITANSVMRGKLGKQLRGSGEVISTLTIRDAREAVYKLPKMFGAFITREHYFSGKLPNVPPEALATTFAVQAVLDGNPIPFPAPHGSAFISVNLHASDDHILNDFKEWLAMKRRDDPISVPKKQFCEKDYKQWSEYSVLPYLDLKIWSTFNNINITQAVIGNAIFPDETVDTTERIRRTTKPKADWLIKSSVLDGFAAQIRKKVKSKTT